MTDISRVHEMGASGNLPVSSKKEAPPKSKEAQVDTSDKLSIGGHLKKAAKTVGGAALGAVIGTLNAVDRGMSSSVEAAYKGAGLDDTETSLGKNVQRLAIAAGSIGGLVMGASGGIPGMLVGAMVGPGVVGGLIEGGKGVIQGGKAGIQAAKTAAGKAESYVTKKMGKLAGKAAKVATLAGVGAVATPALAIAGSVIKGIDFACKAIGVKPEVKTTGEAISNLAKEGTVLYGYVAGALESGPGLAAGIAGGVATAGGLGTLVSGIKGGAKGAVEGFKIGMNIVNKK